MILLIKYPSIPLIRQEEVGREWGVGGGGGRGGRAINTVRISATAAWYHHYTCWHCCDRHRRQSGDHELQAFSCTTLKYTEQYRNSLFIRTSISLNYLGENQVKALTPVIFRRQITAPKFAPTTCRIKIKNLGTTVFFQIFFMVLDSSTDVAYRCTRLFL